MLVSPFAPDLFAAVPCTSVGAVVEVAHKQGWHTMHARAMCSLYNLGDDACGLNFTSLFVTGDGIVAHLWRRSGPAEQNPADDGMTIDEARATARAVTACHPNVTAWAREDVPPRLRYSDNARIGPVVVAADVGYLMCGYASFDSKVRRRLNLDESSDLATARASDPANWALAHVADAGCAPACVGGDAGTDGDGVGKESDDSMYADECGGSHGYDNAAPEMRAVFLARGPLFRSDGARLVGELGYESRRRRPLFLAEEPPAPCAGQVQLFPGARDADVKEPPLFLDVAVVL